MSLLNLMFLTYDGFVLISWIWFFDFEMHVFKCVFLELSISVSGHDHISEGNSY